MDQLLAIIAFFNLRTLIVLGLVFVPLERILSLHEEQKTLRPNLSVDLIYFFIIGQLTRLALGLVLVGAMAVITVLVPPVVGSAIGGQPLVLQVIEALIIADVGLYFAHRMFHAVPWLWRFHAVHHSSEQLDWMSAYRVHPVDQVLTKAISLLPLFALGYSAEALGILFAIQTAHAVLVHANIHFDFGPLRWLVVTPQFHHWHHADERHAYDKNFAAQLPILDWLGGTMHLPGKTYPQRYGAHPAPPSNEPLAQLIEPFQGKRKRKPKPAPAAE